MKKIFGILTMIIFCVKITIFTSCNPFIDESLTEVFPDTVVSINSLAPQVCDVNLKKTDSSYIVTRYWTDKYTGRIVYKMKEEPFLHNKLHGTKFEFNQYGDTLSIQHFDKGIRVDSSVYKYPSGSIKHKIYYSANKDGVIEFEVQYHENGMKKTDLIAYEEGKINGEVHFYDDSPKSKKTETYYYREGVIIGIKIYNEQYAELDRRKELLIKGYREDSIRIAEALLAEAELNGSAYEIPVFYIGTENDAMYEIGKPDNWDIMKIDPVFMLKYYNR